MTIFIVTELATSHYLNQCRHDSSTHICSTEIQHPFDFCIFQNVKVWLHCCYSKRTMTEILYLKCNIVANWYRRLSRQPCTHRFIDYNGVHLCCIYIWNTIRNINHPLWIEISHDGNIPWESFSYYVRKPGPRRLSGAQRDRPKVAVTKFCIGWEVAFLVLHNVYELLLASFNILQMEMPTGLSVTKYFCSKSL